MIFCPSLWQIQNERYNYVFHIDDITSDSFDIFHNAAQYFTVLIFDSLDREVITSMLSQPQFHKFHQEDTWRATDSYRLTTTTK